MHDIYHFASLWLPLQLLLSKVSGARSHELSPVRRSKLEVETTEWRGPFSLALLSLWLGVAYSCKKGNGDTECEVYITLAGLMGPGLVYGASEPHFEETYLNVFFSQHSCDGQACNLLLYICTRQIQRRFTRGSTINERHRYGSTTCRHGDEVSTGYNIPHSTPDSTNV